MIEYAGLPARVLKKLLLEVGQDIDGILDSTRVMVQDTVRDGINEGLSAAELGDRLEQAAAFDEYRAETIARTETATLLNRAATESYREFGITHVTVIDGNDDDVCAEANGQVWTLEEAEANPIAHPNCVRDFAPFFGTPETVTDAGPTTEPESDTDRLAISPDDLPRAPDSTLTPSEAQAALDQEALDQFSSEFAGQYQSLPTETGAILEPDGTVLRVLEGDSLEAVAAQNIAAANPEQQIGGSVQLNGYESLAGRVVVHTHPGTDNMPFSDNDVRFAMTRGVAEIRAEGIDVTYKMRPGREDGQWWEVVPGTEQRGEMSTRMQTTFDRYLREFSDQGDRWLEENAGLIRNPETGIGFVHADTGERAHSNAISVAWMDSAWKATADEMGWIYEAQVR